MIVKQTLIMPETGKWRWLWVYVSEKQGALYAGQDWRKALLENREDCIAGKRC